MGGKKSNHIRKFLTSFTRVRVWQLILILIPLLFLCATLLRFDHLRMIELRTAVIEADEGGDPVAIEETIGALKSFVFTNVVINITEANGVQSVEFGTGPFYLEQSYRRAANAAIEAAEQGVIDDSNPNGNIYAAVSAICQPQAIANGWAWSSPGYLDCWTSELAKYPTSDELSPAVIMADVPSTEEFRRDFASPVWAPTATGFVMLACAILLIWIILRILIWIVLKIALIFLKRA